MQWKGGKDKDTIMLLWIIVQFSFVSLGFTQSDYKDGDGNIKDASMDSILGSLQMDEEERE